MEKQKLKTSNFSRIEIDSKQPQRTEGAEHTRNKFIKIISPGGIQLILPPGTPNAQVLSYTLLMLTMNNICRLDESFIYYLHNKPCDMKDMDLIRY